MKKLELRIFRFDKDKDYEAYYKPYVYDNYENFLTFYDLFLQIQDDDIYFNFEKNEKNYIVVNKEVLRLDSPLEHMVKKYDFDLTIEPLSTKRSIRDFIINKEDFLEKYKYLANFADDEDRKNYKRYDYLYYSSEILDFLPDYMGDALFYLAGKIIKKCPYKKLEILKILCDLDRGIFYHIASKNAKLEELIAQLQDEILKLGLLDKNLLYFQLPRISAFEDQNRQVKKIKYDFRNFNIASYGFEIPHTLRSKLRANFICYENSSKDSGFSLLKLNPKLSYKMAANILLDAYDSGADFMVVRQAKDFYMFDTCSKKLMQTSGREFNDFYILSECELLALIGGIKNPSLRDHQLRVSLI